MRCIAMLALLLSTAASVQADPPKTSIANFTLKSIAGKPWSLDDSRDKKAVVVIFIGTQCPINNAYMPKLVELEKEYRDKGVQFVAINANAHDSMETITSHAKKHGLRFPVLRDEKQVVAAQLGAERHPTAIVLDAKHKICYEGRIDDQFGVGFNRPQPTRRDLAEAIDEVLAGKVVTTAKTPVEGCFITKTPAAKAMKTEVTYSKDIARIVQNRCQECHRPGQIGPMPLLNYDDVSSWAQMIHEVVADNRMPPWHADPKFGKWKNDRRLSSDDRGKLLAWIDAGCPKGDDKDLPEPKKYVEGWSIGTPDAVFKMPQPFTVPAKAPKGGVPYKYFVVPTNFEEDKWIQAVEAKPGNYGVVHHIIVYVINAGKREKNAADGVGSGMLVPYAPGDLGNIFPLGTAKKIPKGASLAFQMHYTPNGTEQVDQSCVGLVFAKEPPKNESKTRGIAQQAFIIPAGADNHKVTSRTTFTQDVLLHGMFPHMHLRGKSFQFEVVYPDGKRDTLLNVPRYDVGWQANYLLEQPLRLPASTKIECTAHLEQFREEPEQPRSVAHRHLGRANLA